MQIVKYHNDGSDENRVKRGGKVLNRVSGGSENVGLQIKEGSGQTFL